MSETSTRSGTDTHRPVLRIGPVSLHNNILLAPMSGVTDWPFRRLAHRYGAGMVVTEMVASEALAQGRGVAAERLAAEGVWPHVVQLAGREARWMAQGARVAEAHGADIIDINMGCPARQVTRGASGSALMRDLDHACALIEATVNAVSVPVTLKMRLGWDDGTRNAPELARRAEALGVRMLTVHGRTRCQFFSGAADWRFIARVKQAVSIPVIANGDAGSLADVRDMLAQSGADGVMIGRGAYGRPWLPGRIAKALAAGRGIEVPSGTEQRDLMIEQYAHMLQLYGRARGLRTARKHLAWHIERCARGPAMASHWRERLCRATDPAAVIGGLSAFHDMALEAA